MATVPAVAGLFFPLREALGLEARELTPGLVERITFAAAESRSFKRAALVLAKVGDATVAKATVQRVVGEIGRELAVRRDVVSKQVEPLAERPESPPALAVVECDGGRIRTREPGHGRGVQLSGEGWRETKNACLMHAKHQVSESDPEPEPPKCFLDAKHVAKIAQTEALSIAAPSAAPLPSDEDLAKLDNNEKEVRRKKPKNGRRKNKKEKKNDWRPVRCMRTVISSLASSRVFGRQMAREAKRRRFQEASAKAFLGDGLAWNWTIWKEHFSDFTPILDFIHPLAYLFLAAKTVHSCSVDDAWSQYVAWMRGCWQGEVAQVIDELCVWQNKLGAPPPKAPATDPREIIATTITYLTNNINRMHYVEYRKAGLPITTAWMESLVKEVNYRVKGTEMYWNDPEGGEAILQIRAASLSDDDRLSKHLRSRPGCAFTRRPKPPKLPAETCKS